MISIHVPDICDFWTDLSQVDPSKLKSFPSKVQSCKSTLY